MTIILTAAALAKLTLDDLNHQIALTESRLRRALSLTRRKLALAHLRWLEAERERLHGVAAPQRRLREGAET